MSARCSPRKWDLHKRWSEIEECLVDTAQIDLLLRCGVWHITWRPRTHQRHIHSVWLAFGWTAFSLCLPKCIGRSMFCVIQLFESGYGQEFLHRNTILQQQFHEINSIVLKCLHHRTIECTVRPFLAINENFATSNVNTIPGQCQTQLFRRWEMLWFEQSRQYCLI